MARSLPTTHNTLTTMAFSSASKAEKTPLISGRRPNNDEGPRRRTVPQHLLQQHSYPYPPSIDESSNKSDRRSFVGRACNSVTNVCCARPPTDTQGGYYEDDFNNESWECTFGTTDQDGIWVNNSDKVGTIMSSLVWVLFIYSCLTITLLAQHNHLKNRIAMVYITICALALASHAKTSFTDPGSIPREAVPPASLFKRGITTHSMCSHCQTYKPTNSHHCRICNRCISKMDHHCPWMNNCIGAGNFKHFILFLCYTWTGCAYALIIFAGNYFLCNSDYCTFSLVLVHLVRAMTFLCIMTLLFTSSMIMNVTYGIMTGIGTIDRLKKKATDTGFYSEEEPIELKDIFGIQGYWTWALPMDPVLEDYDRVMGYSLPQRLLREPASDAETGGYDRIESTGSKYSV